MTDKEILLTGELLEKKAQRIAVLEKLLSNETELRQKWEGLVREQEQQLLEANARAERLRKHLDHEERSHIETIKHRDAHEERINEIGAALGLDEAGLTWSNLNDVGERCVQEADRLVDSEQEANARASVCVNAFKAFQMAAEGKISEKEFESIIARSESDLTKAAEWLSGYTNTAVEQIADLQAELATAKRDGAVEELRRLADERYVAGLPGSAAIRDRADELEGK